jgi:hypothetical protein
MDRSLWNLLVDHYGKQWTLFILEMLAGPTPKTVRSQNRVENFIGHTPHIFLVAGLWDHILERNSLIHFKQATYKNGIDPRECRTIHEMESDLSKAGYK